MSEERGPLPDHLMYSRDGYLMYKPTENSLMEQRANQAAASQKAATLRGQRPSEQAIRDNQARARAAQTKDHQNRNPSPSR